jgi:sec-independent protein translocase protein TatA
VYTFQCAARKRIFGALTEEGNIMLGLGGQELIILLVIVLVLFGGSKVPQLMKGLGEGMKEFKKATRDEDELPRPVERTVTVEKPISTHSEPRV